MGLNPVEVVQEVPILELGLSTTTAVGEVEVQEDGIIELAKGVVLFVPMGSPGLYISYRRI